MNTDDPSAGLVPTPEEVRRAWGADGISLLPPQRHVTWWAVVLHLGDLEKIVMRSDTLDEALRGARKAAEFLKDGKVMGWPGVPMPEEPTP